MTTIEMELGVLNAFTTHVFDPGVDITIDGDHALALEVLKYLEKFVSPAGQIEVK